MSSPLSFLSLFYRGAHMRLLALTSLVGGLGGPHSFYQYDAMRVMVRCAPHPRAARRASFCRAHAARATLRGPTRRYWHPVDAPAAGGDGLGHAGARALLGVHVDVRHPCFSSHPIAPPISRLTSALTPSSGAASPGRTSPAGCSARPARGARCSSARQLPRATWSFYTVVDWH
jgi:hypothetical protein